ncbi:MAG TPA: hypothetical protein VNW06_12170 [Cytophagaceae bacterium]|jgi:hypothetical protein|nr:hypothetical protein [Cytophagaceae bacterium]
MKKVEIEIEASVLDRVVDILDENDLLSQTELIEEVSTKRNITKNGIFSTRNVRNLSVICSTKQKDKLLTRLFPLINMFGGFCISHDILY